MTLLLTMGLKVAKHMGPCSSTTAVSLSSAHCLSVYWHTMVSNALPSGFSLVFGYIWLQQDGTLPRMQCCTYWWSSIPLASISWHGWLVVSYKENGFYFGQALHWSLCLCCLASTMVSMDCWQTRYCSKKTGRNAWKRGGIFNRWQSGSSSSEVLDRPLQRRTHSHIRVVVEKHNIIKLSSYVIATTECCCWFFLVFGRSLFSFSNLSSNNAPLSLQAQKSSSKTCRCRPFLNAIQQLHVLQSRSHRGAQGKYSQPVIFWVCMVGWDVCGIIFEI